MMNDLTDQSPLICFLSLMQVCDFGLSRLLDSEYLHSTGIGTVQYTSPEVMRGEKVGEKSDVFSFGVVLWELVTGKQPWMGWRPEQVVFAMGVNKELLPLDDSMQPEVRSLIQACWHPLPRERPSFAAILESLSAMSSIMSLSE
jgi:serine/threonine protein kinase